MSVNHANFTDPAYVHEAIVAWVEAILDSNFTVCVTQAGRNKKNNGETLASVDWLAYQGAPVGGVSGEVDMPTWWTGTACQSVSLPSVCIVLQIDRQANGSTPSIPLHSEQKIATKKALADFVTLCHDHNKVGQIEKLLNFSLYFLIMYRIH